MKGYEALAELARRAGFRAVFSMLGGSNVPWIAHGVSRGSLRLVKTRHEDAAVSGAVGYARSTGRPALCSVTRGPGLTNSISALVAAVKSHVPILLVTGESPTTKLPSQNVDQAGLAHVIGAGLHHVDTAGELERTFSVALGRMRTSSGPQVLSVDSEVFGQLVDLGDETSPEAIRCQPVDADEVTEAFRLLRGADHPILLAGAGAVFSCCRDQLVELAELSGARLATTLRALNLFAGHPGDLGLCGGWSPPAVRRELAAADLVVAVGASLNDYTTDRGTTFPGAAVVHCELDDEREYGLVRPDVVVRGDARIVLTALVDAWRAAGLPPAGAARATVTHAATRQAVLDVDLGHDPSRGLDPREVYARLDDLLPEDRVVVTDSGRFLGTLPSLVRSRDATSWLVGNSYSCVGLGLGAAIGACTAHPDRPVVLFTGDGGFIMSSHDLDAVRLNALDLTVIVLNDEQYGSDAKYLSLHGLDKAIISQSLPDVAALAGAFGGTGVVVRTLADLDDVDFRQPGLRILDVRIDPEVNVRTVLAGWAARAAAEREAVVR